MSSESILALISLFLGVLSASICGVVFLLKQDEAVKSSFHHRINTLHDERNEDNNINKERYHNIAIAIKELKQQIAFLETIVNDLSGWAYKKGFIPKHFLPNSEIDNDDTHGD